MKKTVILMPKQGTGSHETTFIAFVTKSGLRLSFVFHEFKIILFYIVLMKPGS